MQVAIAPGSRDQGVDRSKGSALVALSAASGENTHACLRPRAPFLAQLIAARLAFPQARALRRADPAVAADAYLRAERSTLPT